ncbi:MAG: hypothetical protein HYX40_12125 [Sphingobacteriales bacterium]|nr:hypothetical protein [Sphingobacteriales bacterium]
MTYSIKVNCDIISTNPIKLSSPDIREISCIISGTNKRSYGYILNSITLKVSSSTGWALYNDGCFYHGTFLSDSVSGVSIFIADSNPWTDNYIGNEPKCGYGNIARYSNNLLKETLTLNF